MEESEMLDKEAKEVQNTEEISESAGDPQDSDLKAELERVRIALQAANKEAADRRKKLEQLEKAEAERKQAEMTELEKANAAREAAEKRASDAEARATQRMIESAFVAEASRLGVKHPEDAYALADKSLVTVGEDGKVTGVADSVKALVDAGRLVMASVAVASADGGAGAGRGQQRAALTPSEEDIAKKIGLSAEDYATYKTTKSASLVEKTER
jgi:hypothetical protein